MFVAMPSYRTGNKYRDVCFPITKEFREKINDAVLAAYRLAKEQAVQEHASAQMQTGDRGFMKYSGEIRHLVKVQDPPAVNPLKELSAPERLLTQREGSLYHFFFSRTP